MKIPRILALIAVTLLMQGCLSFSMGPERSFPDTVSRTQVQVRRISEFVPVITPTGFESLYKLELVAVGDFVRHNGHIVKRGSPCLSIGLFPGFADEGKTGLKAVLTFFANATLIGIPTIASLVFEPFRDYRDRADGDLADYGLIGCNKYYTNVRKDTTAGFVTESTERFSRYSLYGYGVVIDGKRFDDNDSGRGYQGVVYFRSARPRGSRITIKIVDPPSARGDSGDDFSGAQGLELIGVIP